MEIQTGKRPPNDRRNGVAESEGMSLGRKSLACLGVEALSAQLSRIHDFVDVVSEESDVEDIHQMRVATRRFRTMARLLEETPAFRRKPVNRLRARLQPMADRLGAVRDLDILLEHLDDYEHTLSETDETDETDETRRDWWREERASCGLESSP